MTQATNVSKDSTVRWQRTLNLLSYRPWLLDESEVKAVLLKLSKSLAYKSALNDFSRDQAIAESDDKETLVWTDEYFAIEQSQRMAELEQLVYHLCYLVTRQYECRQEALSLQQPELVKQHITSQFPVIQGTRTQEIVKILGQRKRDSESLAVGRILRKLLFKEERSDNPSTTADMTDDEKGLLLRSVTDPTDCWEMHPEDNDALQSLQRKGLSEFEIDDENAEFYLTPNGQQLIEKFIAAGWKEVEEAGFGAAISEVKA